jgi:acetyltransferase-like isoleucine patch superfamily enzyme
VNAKELASKAFWALKEQEPEAQRWVNAARREALIGRVRAQAAWKRSSVDIDIDPSATIGPDVAITVDPGTTSRLLLGPGTSLAGQLRIHLRGGLITIADRTSIRQHTVLNVSGRFEVGPDSILSYGTIVHCAQRITLSQIVGIAEYVTLVDSTHFLTDERTRHYDNVRTKPVTIGRNTWLCPKSTVTMGVTIGDYCVVGSGVTVTQDVPDGHSVGQAQTIQRRRRLPWDPEVAVVAAVQVPA